MLWLATLFVAPAALAQEAPGDPAAERLLPTTEQWLGDLDGMRKRRQIRMLVPYSKTFFFVDKGGKQAGITHDVGHAFEEWLNKREKTKTLKISIVFIPVARDRLLSGLVDGLGDIAAGNITITEERAKIVQFGDPFAKDVKEVLVTGPTAAPIATLDDLAGREIHVRRSSSYFEHLEAVSRALEAKGLKSIAISDLDDELEDEDIMEMVNAGLLPWAVVDEHKAQIWTSIFTKLTVRSDLAINAGGEIAWAMRKDDPQLLAVLNEFTKTHKIGTTFGNILKKRYLGSDSFVKRSTSTEEIDKFQAIAELFRKYGQQYDFDWLMIAAQGYQESQLDQSARSPRGAVGVMQLMPKTAADPTVGIPDIESVDNNIHAGVKYLRTLVDKYLDDPALDRKNRTLMAFAAYNAGPGNLRKFRKLAAESGLDPNIWFHNVEHAAAEIVGRETVQYVANIYKYYVAYRLATERNEERSKAKQGLAPAPQ
ncbi:MAG TPA: transporter substrate-binding domain-containing protein [Dongiaceae bacterium]|nr:transporter substrate-binding domain-containing protein [Dongiaceae bacterium]